jgi:hypothetical protein
MSGLGDFASGAVAIGALGLLGVAAIIGAKRSGQPHSYVPPLQEQSKLHIVPASEQALGRQRQAARRRKKRGAELPPAESLVTLAEERRAAGIDEVLAVNKSSMAERS